MTLATTERAAVAVPPAAEAARYALLRRLAPSMRHHLVVNLQPIGMIYEVMDRRLRMPEPDLAQVQESASKINGFARAALASCIDVVSWLAPDDASTGVPEGVRECLALLATSLSFRGFSLRNDVGAFKQRVRRSALRNVLTAALLHITDELAPPAELHVAGSATSEGLTLQVELRTTKGEGGFVPESVYRPLAWSDILALAASEGATVERAAPGRVNLLLPWA